MKTAIIDLDSVCYSIGNGVKLLDDQGNPIREDGKRFVYRDKTTQELKDSADFYMNQLLKQGGFTHYIGYMKGEDTTSFRLAANPNYKGNRSKIEPSWWEFVQRDLFYRWECHYVHDIEVDDAVNITRLQLKDSFLCAIDYDLLGLEGTHYNWRTNRWITTTKEEAEYKFWADMICGQVGDNIKGLPDRGPAFVKKLFHNTTDSQNYMTRVLTAYCIDLGEYEGIKEFHKNYISLKILESRPGFVTPEPIPIPTTETNIEQLFKN